MTFKGYGIIWNPKKNRTLVDFGSNPEYNTNDPYEIEVLSASDHVTSQSGEIEIEETIIVSEDSGKTKKVVMEELDASGIEYNPRDKKEVLLKLLEG